MRVRATHKTAFLAWSPVPPTAAAAAAAGPPGTNATYLAAGTAAGAVSDNFAVTTELDIYDLDLGGVGDSRDGSDGRASPSRAVEADGARPLKKIGSVDSGSRFHRIAWSFVPDEAAARPLGMIAGGMDDGSVTLWDPHAIVNAPAGASPAEVAKRALITKTTSHSGPVKALDLHPLKPKLLATGSISSEVFIWDLTHPTHPFAPGAKSQKMDDVTTLAWNRPYPNILASGATNGAVVIWDLRHKGELLTLTHPEGRKPISGLAWHPTLATQLATAARDDLNPVIHLWDLRNASSPFRTLTGHRAGVLNVAWCPRDHDLLISCAKDHRTLVWDLSASAAADDATLSASAAAPEAFSELDQTSNWTFEAQWCQRNPDLVALSSFDGTVGVYSLQGGGGGSHAAAAAADGADTSLSGDAGDASVAYDPSDPFAQVRANVSHAHAHQQATRPPFRLRKPPQWLRRPCNVSWGFGMTLVQCTTSAGAAATPAPGAPGAPGAPAPAADALHGATSAVQLRHVTLDDAADARVAELNEVLQAVGAPDHVERVRACCERQRAPAGGDPSSPPDDAALWQFLAEHYGDMTPDDILAYLGYSSADAHAASGAAEGETSAAGSPAHGGDENGNGNGDGNASHSHRHDTAEGPSLLTDQPEASFGTLLQPPAGQPNWYQPYPGTAHPSHGGQDAYSVSQTSGYGYANASGYGPPHDASLSHQPSEAPLPEAPQEAAPATPKLPPFPRVACPDVFQSLESTFTLFASSASAAATATAPEVTADQRDPRAIDDLLVRSLLHGDPTLALDACLRAHRFADALLLTTRHPQLQPRVYAAYFAACAPRQPHARLLLNLFAGDLRDAVESVRLDAGRWRDALALIWRYAPVTTVQPDGSRHVDTADARALTGLLAARLHKAWRRKTQRPPASAEPPAAAADQDDDDGRFPVVLCHLLAGDLPALAALWLNDHAHTAQPLTLIRGGAAAGAALHRLVIKLTVVRAALGFVDPALAQGPADSEGPPAFPLAGVYDVSIAYAQYLALLGYPDMAWHVLAYVPQDYRPDMPEAAAGRDEHDLAATDAAAAGGAAANPVDVLRDRLFQRLTGGMQATAAAPPFPFEHIEVGLPPQVLPNQQPTGYDAYGQPLSTASQHEQSSMYGGYDSHQQQQQQQQQQSMNPYGQTNGYGQPPYAPTIGPPMNPYGGYSGPPSSVPSATNVYGAPPVSQGGYGAPSAPAVSAYGAPSYSAPSYGAPPASGGFHAYGATGSAYGGGSGGYGTTQPPPGPPLGPLPTMTPLAPPPPTAAAAAGISTFIPTQAPALGPPPIGPPPVGPPPTGAPPIASTASLGVPRAGAAGVLSPTAAGLAPNGPLSPLGQAHGLAGPPMGIGAASSAMPPVPSPGAAAAPLPPPPPAPSRDTVPAAQKPIYDQLLRLLDDAKAKSVTPAQTRVFDDAERRLAALLDQMRRGALAPAIATTLGTLLGHVERQAYPPAQALQVQLMSTHFEQVGSWIVGLKRLIDFLDRDHKEKTAPPPAPASMPGMPPPPPTGRGIGPPPIGPPPIGPPPTSFGAPPMNAPPMSGPPPGSGASQPATSMGMPPMGHPPMPLTRYAAPPASQGGYAAMGPPPAAMGRPAAGASPTSFGAPPTSFGAPPMGGPPVGAPPMRGPPTQPPQQQQQQQQQPPPPANSMPPSHAYGGYHSGPPGGAPPPQGPPQGYGGAPGYGNYAAGPPPSTTGPPPHGSGYY
ncbi:hypothetical protein CXG81DRAFT_24690 [Caulochytrium protostelioides]|uniref:Protein transport protein SEC31 n=1 Tax=Caulochytrium protostelioides TaxID=1555241 RepID=A0A4P9XB61_9FUNG|nr:hypothetical protein CXG81DRAFT_24690 [Caulochytrium protostelioides]|eukprot:RKP02637.1 hypothetical protein CXG81DRAFT_24690 [Caulochytrium protostelioides]